jgi:hypothetical protein
MGVDQLAEVTSQQTQTVEFSEGNGVPSLEELQKLPLETLLTDTPGLSYVQRFRTTDENGQSVDGWRAMGSQGRRGGVVQASTIPEALFELQTRFPYHLGSDYGKRENEPIPLDLRKRVLLDLLTKTMTPDEKLKLCGKTVRMIKHNWEYHQNWRIPEAEGRWTVESVSESGKTRALFQGNTLSDVLGEAYLWKLGIEILGNDDEFVYLKGFYPTLGLRHEDGHKGLETKVPIPPPDNKEAIAAK